MVHMFFHCAPKVTPNRGGTIECREYWILLSAEDAGAAYTKAFMLAATTIRRIEGILDSQWEVDGISELLPTIEEPVASSELMWHEREVTPGEVDALVKHKSDLLAFGPHTVGEGVWYIAALVYVEIHETGVHGDCLLVWINRHFVIGNDAESAYALALSLGNEYAATGAHCCNGNNAHWAFKGLRELVRTTEESGDGAVIWIDTFRLSPLELTSLIPPKSELGVFRLESEKRSRVEETRGRP